MKIVSAVLCALVALGATGRAFAADQTLSVTGQISDAMCGAKHEMPGTPAECTHACVGQGSKFALVVGDKVYTLTSDDKAMEAKLSQLAGAKALVKGRAHGDTIEVSSVAPGN
jgi:hypothetical protein